MGGILTGRAILELPPRDALQRWEILTSRASRAAQEGISGDSITFLADGWIEVTLAPGVRSSVVDDMARVVWNYNCGVESLPGESEASGNVTSLYLEWEAGYLDPALGVVVGIGVQDRLGTPVDGTGAAYYFAINKCLAPGEIGAEYATSAGHSYSAVDIGGEEIKSNVMLVSSSINPAFALAARAGGGLGYSSDGDGGLLMPGSFGGNPERYPSIVLGTSVEGAEPVTLRVRPWILKIVSTYNAGPAT